MILGGSISSNTANRFLPASLLTAFQNKSGGVYPEEWLNEWMNEWMKIQNCFNLLMHWAEVFYCPGWIWQLGAQGHRQNFQRLVEQLCKEECLFYHLFHFPLSSNKTYCLNSAETLARVLPIETYTPLHCGQDQSCLRCVTVTLAYSS